MSEPRESALTQLAHASLEHYATNAAARAAMAAIPFLGGGVDALIGTAGSNRLADQFAQRVEIAFEELRDQLDAVRERLDKSITEEQLLDTAIKAMRGSIETGDREKVRALVAILAEAATERGPDGLDPEAVLTELINLSSVTLRVARRMYDEASAAWHPVTSGVPAPSDLPDADFHVQKLEAAGLIQVIQPMATIGPGTFKPTRYEPTATFRRMMAMVRHEPAP